MPTGHYAHKPLSEEHKRKIGLSNVGKVRSEETLNTLRESHKTERSLISALKNIQIAQEANTGRIYPEEHRIAIGTALREYYETNPDARRTISARQRGERSKNWKGGLRTINKILRQGVEWKIWRDSVFKRDGYQCQKCGARGGNGHRVTLHPHHIKSFAEYEELRFNVGNGITLCFSCHKDEHSHKK